ncbi:MAG TPA: hypothetical protein VKW04_01455 [Planctomycetota bacterium]|nr:hypothetical protein [Planctomycetota bacterium]
MGKEIVYCSRCQSRLTGADFDTGTAVRISNYIYCTVCLSPAERLIVEKLSMPPGPPPSTRRTSTRRTTNSSSGALVAAPRGTADPTPAWRNPLVLTVAGTAGVLIVLLIVVLSRGATGKTELSETAPAPPNVPSPIRPTEAPRTWDWTPHLDALKAELNPSLAQKNYRVAQVILERGRSQHADPRWSQELGALEQDLNEKVRARYRELKDAATRAVERKAVEEIRTSRAEIAQWGPSFQPFLKEFEEAFGTTLAKASLPDPSTIPRPEEPPPPPPKPADPGPVPLADPQRSDAGRKYLGAWQKAMGFASRRDYQAAIVELNAAARDFKEEDVKKEIVEDLQDVEHVQALSGDLRQEMAGLPSWTPVTLEVDQEDGSRSTVHGQVLRAGARRLELRGEPYYVELEDIRPGSLVTLTLQKKKDRTVDEIRILALICALDGDDASLAKVLEGRSDLLAPKVRNYCAALQAKAPDGDAVARRSEWAARKLFYQAETEFRTLETRAAALEKYDLLMAVHSGTSFVKNTRAEIVARKEESKDYGFTALHLKGKGGFGVQKLQVGIAKDKVDMIGWKTREEPAADDPNTFVEASFFALPDTEYKAWALIGGCCASTFTWFLQASELTYVDRKTSKTLNCDPGSNFAAPWTLRLTKLSTVHGGKNHAKADKEPTIWEWVEIPMPKYAASGVKTIRFMAASKGMALAAVMVTALKDKRPGPETTKTFAELSIDEGVPTSSLKAGKGEPDLLTQIPEARPFVLVHDLDLAKMGRPVKYDADHRSEVTRSFDRIAYLLELQKGAGPAQYVFVSMDAFTDDINKVGIPDLSSGARFQQNVTSMNVHSNVEGLTTGIMLDGGNIEFWTNNYGPANAANVPGASPSVFDFGDQITDPVDGYGSMQVHNHKVGQTIFALNHWRDGGEGADLGIGNSTGPNPDWTFLRNSGSYSYKRLRILVRPRP